MHKQQKEQDLGCKRQGVFACIVIVKVSHLCTTNFINYIPIFLLTLTMKNIYDFKTKEYVDVLTS